MIDGKSLLSDIANEINQQQRKLLVQQAAVLVFVDTDHKSKTTKEQLKTLRKSEAEINSIMLDIVDLQSVPELRNETDKLCGRCDKLYDYTRDIRTVLLEDLADRQHSEDGNRSDIAKNAGASASIILLFLTAQNRDLLAHGTSARDAAIRGIETAAVVVWHKEIWQGFKNADKAVCWTSEKIGAIISAERAAVKKSDDAAKEVFKETGKALSARFSKMAARAKNFAGKLADMRKPKP